ncbi:glycerophosphodiester phosphodiesterase family protein [Haloactinopolyspora alba]|uniref:glycerophosphodiester phosphodiesterase family protein n=1 Tax=Haloactinopolyspora alba TaxID=648780 RepID=UPI00197ADDDC|nr:glycerophosphodiester phosphodiesterase family protein [Haloactinopolyspora alba]
MFRTSTGPAAPVVVAHRGACGYRPEHTLAAYRLAIDLGADYIEPDLVLSADGVLVARHDAELAASTDVADRPEFAARRRTATVSGREVCGWFVDDFTVAELKTLSMRERIPGLRPRNRAYDGRFRIPTFDEIVDEAIRAGRERGRPVGLYVELKRATDLAEAGREPEDALLDALRGFRLERAGVRVLVESFEPSVLRRLARRSSLTLVQRVDIAGRPYEWERASDGRRYADMLTPGGLREMSSYASVLGAHKSLLLPRDPEGRLGRPGRLIGDAHELGMAVHAWTFRNENTFLPAEHRRGSEPGAHGDAAGEYAAFFAAGVDGVVSDHPDTALAARAEYLAGQTPASSGSRSRRSLFNDAIRPARPMETNRTGAATSRPDRPRTS